jgi:hypothetical protein
MQKLMAHGWLTDVLLRIPICSRLATSPVVRIIAAYRNILMLNEHDQDLNLRCPHLGHEVPFGYCRRESDGKPCRLILNCWRDNFDVQSFLKAHLTEEAMAHIRQTDGPPTL